MVKVGTFVRAASLPAVYWFYVFAFLLAYVTFDKSKWTGESVAQAIDDMGYDAKLKAVSGKDTVFFKFYSFYYALAGFC